MSAKSLRSLRMYKTARVTAIEIGHWSSRNYGMLVIIIALFVWSHIAAAATSADISVVGDAVNIEFEGHSDWPYDLNRKGKVIELRVPKIDPATRSRLLTWKGPLIQKIELKAGIDESDIIVFTLTKSDIQTFDYLSDQPSRLIVDFFVADEKVQAANAKEASESASNQKPVAKKSVSNGKVASRLPNKGERKPAASEIMQSDENNSKQLAANTEATEPKGDSKSQGVFDGADPDFERFSIKDYEINEAAIIASRRNVYIKFPMLTMQDQSLQELVSNSPIYEIKPTDTDENKKARLLLTLFQNKRYAIYLRTIQFFRQAYPDSKYNEIIRFMEADIYFELSKRDKSQSDFQVAMTKYKSLLLDFPESPLAERTQLLIGYSYLERGEILNALAELQGFVRKYATSEHRHKVKIAIADSYRKLNRYDDAEKILGEVEGDPTAGELGVAAAYKRADNKFERQDYDDAIKAYQANQKKYPAQHDKFPSAGYNSAEALFWKQDYKKSLDTYRAFLQKYPTSSHGGYAMTRVGELLEILGASEEKITGAFLESMFRYRGSQGAGVANMRLMRSKIKSMKPKEIENKMGEVQEFVKDSSLPKIKDFEVIMVSDGFFSRKDYNRATDILVKYYQDNPTATNLSIVKDRIVRTITEQMSDLVEGHNYIPAFRLYGKNASTWLKTSDRIDLAYSLGKSYEGTGVPDQAAKVYREVLNKLYAIKGTKEEKERAVFESLPSTETVNLRLASQHIKLNQPAQAGKYLSDIKSPESLNDSEKVERVSLWADVARAKGDNKLAEKYLKELVDTWQGQPEKLAPVYNDLATLSFESKNYDAAESAITRLLNLSQDSTSVGQDYKITAMQLKGDIALAKGQKNEAVEAYENLLEQYESKVPLGSTRYKVGKIYFEQGKLVEAEKSWEPLAHKKENESWSRMAKEQLAHARWQDDYKKYINRIPAMSDEKGKQ